MRFCVKVKVWLCFDIVFDEGFVLVEVGLNWLVLFLFVIIFDVWGWIVGMNDLVEFFLNFLCWLGIGQMLEGFELIKWLCIVLLMNEIIDSVCEGYYDGLNCLGVCFEIGDWLGGYVDCVVMIYVGFVFSFVGGMVVMIVFSESVGWLGQGCVVCLVVCQVIGMVEMLVYEIKNLLVGICGVVQLIGMNFVLEDCDLVDLIVMELCCIVELLDQVECFGDILVFKLIEVNIYDVLECVCWFVIVGFGKGMKIVLDYDFLLFVVLVDNDQLVQVCLNLVKNVVEVICCVGQDIGMIWMCSFYDGMLCMVFIEVEFQGCSLFLQIEIEDDGFGIFDNIVEEIFEFFVLGCENGIGLGLVLVFKIIIDYGVWIVVDSWFGCIVFCIFFFKV